MADDITYSGSGSTVPANTKQVTDEHATRGHMPIVKLAYSADGDATQVTADANGLEVQGAGIAGTPAGGVVSVQGVASGTVLPVSDNGGSLTVDGTVAVSGTVAVTQSGTWDEVGINDSGNSITVDNPALSVTGGGLEASAVRVTIASDSTGLVSVDDNGGSLTVDGTVAVSGTVAVTQSGTWDEVGINDSGNSITVDNAALSVTGGGVEASALRVTLANDSTGVVSVDDNGSTISVDDGAGSLTVDGTVTANLAAGTNNIGDVDVLTIAAGDNNIGNVDIVTMPAVTNAGTFAVQESGGALTALQLIDDTVKTDDAAFTPATDKVLMMGAQADEAAPDSVDEGDAGALRMTLARGLHVNIRDDAGDSAMDGGNNAVRVNVVAGGGTGGTSSVDDSAFTVAVSNMTPIGGMLDDTTPDSIDEGDIGVVRMTGTRAIHVNLRDNSGNEVSVGGGTQYTEDAAAAADPVGTALNLIRKDTLAGLTSADGDNVAARGTDKGELYVKHVDAIPVTDNAGSLTVDNAALSVTGGGVEATALRVTIASDSTGVLSVDDNGGALTVDGTVTANLAAGTNNIGDVDILSIAAGDNNIGNVDIVTMPAVTNAGTFAVQVDGAALTSLQLIDDTVFAEDVAATPADKGVAVLAVRRDADTTLVGADNDYANLQVDANGYLKVEIFDGGGSHTVDGTVTANLAAGTNNIGDVDILTIAAGDNNIGNVDIVTMPNVTLAAGTNTNEVVGDVAHDAAAAGNPVLVAASSETMADSAPANRVSADADASRLSVTDGALYVIPSGPQTWSYHENSSSALTDASVHSAPGAGLSLYVNTIVFSTGAATACNIFFEESTTTVLGPYYLEAVAGRGLVINFVTPKKITANTALTVTTSAAIAHGLDVTGFIAPG